MAVNGGVFTEAVMVLLGGLFMVGSLAKDLRIRGAFTRSAGFPASAAHRAVFFIIGLTTFIEGIRLLNS